MIQEHTEDKIEISDVNDIRKIFSKETGKKRLVLDIFNRTCLSNKFTTGISDYEDFRTENSYVEKIKYIKTDRWEYWILEHWENNWFNSEKAILNKNKFDGESSISRSFFEEKILRYDLREEKFQYQEWYHYTGYNNKTEHYFLDKVWQGRVVFNMKNDSTLVRFKMKNYKQRCTYRTQYLSLKNHETICSKTGLTNKGDLFGELLDIYSGGPVASVLMKSLYNKPIPNKLIKNTKTMAELLKKVNGNEVNIPKKLLGMCNTDLALIIAYIVEPDELNKVTQFIHNQENKIKSFVDSLTSIMSLEEIKSYGLLSNHILYKNDEQRKNRLTIGGSPIVDKNQPLDVPAIKRAACNDLIFTNTSYNMIFFRKLYNHLIPGLEDQDYLVKDYVRMSYELGMKINLKIKSPKRLKQEHDNVSIVYKKKELGEIKSKSWYRVIQSTDKYDIELVDDVDRLVLEGTKMKHCVTSYSNVINSGQSAIFHIKLKDDILLEKLCKEEVEIHKKGWTLEVGVGLNSEGNNFFKYKQFRGYSNINPPIEVVSDINKILDSAPISIYKKEEKSLGLHRPVQQVLYAFEAYEPKEHVEPFFTDMVDRGDDEEDLPF